jgi:hypothetical protein
MDLDLTHSWGHRRFGLKGGVEARRLHRVQSRLLCGKKASTDHAGRGINGFPSGPHRVAEAGVVPRFPQRPDR